jgi:hypothetical protein
MPARFSTAATLRSHASKTPGTGRVEVKLEKMVVAQPPPPMCDGNRAEAYEEIGVAATRACRVCVRVRKTVTSDPSTSARVNEWRDGTAEGFLASLEMTDKE